MVVIKVTKEEWLEILRWDDDGGHPVDIVYEIIEATTNTENEHQETNT